MKTYVKDIRPGGGQVKDYFALVSKESRVASNQKPFVSMVLCDRTGQINAKRWDAEELVEDRGGTVVEAEEIVQVVASVEEWQGRCQLRIEKIRRPKPSEYELADFLPASERPPAEMLDELRALLTHFASPKRTAFFLQVLDTFGPGLAASPAAKFYHHAFIAGLLEHVLSLVKGAIALSRVYPYLDLDVMLAGCIFHDIGKTVELSNGLGFRYTRLGLMHGHIPIGFEITKRFLEANLPDEPEFAEAVLHIVLSHHGELEHGSPVLPKTREALAFHILDLLDSRMGAIDTAWKLPGDQEGFTAFIPMLKTAFWKGAPPCPEEPAPASPQAPQEQTLAPPATQEPSPQTAQPQEASSASSARSSESPSSRTSSPRPASSSSEAPPPPRRRAAATAETADASTSPKQEATDLGNQPPVPTAADPPPPPPRPSSQAPLMQDPRGSSGESYPD